MASQEDNFDIDIYGDGDEEYPDDGQSEAKPRAENVQMDGAGEDPNPNESPLVFNPSANGLTEQVEAEKGNDKSSRDTAQKISSTDQSITELIHLPKQAPQTQGIKRKDGDEDDRCVDPGATTALFISELHWWVTDDDIRGWANQSQCEDELEDITFSEHKVNGKSKGQAYILFKSMQAATAMKQRIETFGGSQQYEKKFAVAFSNPYTNPFKTIPKDGPMRNNTSTTNIRPNSASVQSYTGGGYRGGRGGGFNNRGGAMSGMPNYNRGGFQQPMAGFQGAGVGGFSSMGGMPPIGGFQARRGMVGGGMRGGGMGMRGGRGGMMGLPVNMGMGSMGMGMGMPQMGGMGMQSTNGFQGNPTPYHSAMFNQQPYRSPNYDGGDNPHGTKRIRQD